VWVYVHCLYKCECMYNARISVLF